MKIKKFSLLLAIILILGLLVSCGKKINTEELRKYSDPALESILTAANKDDYSRYSEQFSDKMKEAIPEKVFIEQNKLIKDKIGDYQSKEFVKAQLKGEYTVAIYTAKYTKETKEVMVSITFKNGDNSHKVEGLFITSPKLATK